MAHAVHQMIRDVCGPEARELCAKLKPAPQGKDLLRYIRNVSFIGKSLHRLQSTHKKKSFQLGFGRYSGKYSVKHL